MLIRIPHNPNCCRQLFFKLQSNTQTIIINNHEGQRKGASPFQRLKPESVLQTLGN